MSTLTIRMTEDKHHRLRNLAKAKGVSVNRLIDDLATIALVQYDTELRFRTMAARGSTAQGIALLDKLDTAFQQAPTPKRRNAAP